MPFGRGGGGKFSATERAHKRNAGQIDAEWRLPSLVRIRACNENAAPVFNETMSQAKIGRGGGTGDVRPVKVSSFEEAEAEKAAAKQKEADWKIVEAFLRKMPVTKRLAAVHSELIWYLTKEANPVAHEKCLPDYCYNIFEKIRRTFLKALPKFSDTITVTGDSEALKACKTIDDAKRVVKIDWVRLGTVIGIGIRGMRFVEKEAENTLKREGVWGLVPKGGASNLTLVFDRTRLEKMAKAGGIQDMGRGLQQILKENTAPHIEKMPAMIQTLGQLAYLWGPDALAKLNEGVAIGLKEFLDEEGRPINESVRQNIYEFLLLAWPEIEEMLNAKPKKNVGDLHKWMLPFMRRDMCNLIGPDYLRDVCAPMPSGIGLALRPLSSRSARPSD